LKIKKGEKMESETYDRFNLEAEIMNVWNTKDDIEAITSRMVDDPDGPLTEDQLLNVLTGLSEMHDIRCKKLFNVFESMVRQKNSFIKKGIYMADGLGKVVDDSEKESTFGNNLE